MSLRPLDAQELRSPLILPTTKIRESRKQSALIRLQSWTKMFRKMDVTMSTFKIKLLKALATTNTPPSPKKTMLKSGWIISDPD